MALLLGCAGTAHTPPQPPHAPHATASHLSQADLRADVRELVRLLEESHPDPYAGGGGRVAFHRKARSILDGIPAQGLTQREFLRLLRPLVASVRDGHTAVYEPRAAASTAPPPRTWIELDAAEQRLYVSGVYAEEHRRALGAKVVSIEGVAWPELVQRTMAYRGYDNVYTNVVHLDEVIHHPAELAELLGREALPQRIAMELELADRSRMSLSVSTGSSAPGPAIHPPSRLELPEVDASAVGWGFLERDRSTVMLRVDSMGRYREAFENWQSTGYTGPLGDRLTQVAQQASGRPAPSGVAERIARVPSATETFKRLTAAMREAHTRNLIVDLRRNEGGNSLLASIFAWFFFPLDDVLALDEGYQIPRFSKLYFENNRNFSLEQVRAERHISIELGDLDFSEELAWRELEARGLSPAERQRRLEQFSREASHMPTFDREFRSQPPHAKWPGRIVVLTSARTYSAGYDFAEMLYRLGANVVGVPSAQAGNCFIDSLQYELPHSKLRGTISYKRSLLFPDDPAMGDLLRPHIELTYDKLTASHFDPNASVMLALELLHDQGRMRP